MVLPKQHIVQWVQVKDISTVKDFTCRICRKTLQSAEECGFHMQIVAAAAKWIMRGESVSLIATSICNLSTRDTSLLTETDLYSQNHITKIVAARHSYQYSLEKWKFPRHGNYPLQKHVFLCVVGAWRIKWGWWWRNSGVGICLVTWVTPVGAVDDRVGVPVRCGVI